MRFDLARWASGRPSRPSAGHRQTRLPGRGVTAALLAALTAVASALPLNPAAAAPVAPQAAVAGQTYSAVIASSVSATGPASVVGYTVTITNTGTVAYTALNPASITGNVAGVLDDASYDNDIAVSSGPAAVFAGPILTWSGPLAIGGSVTVTYSVTVDDPDNGDQSLVNTVITPPDSGGDCPFGAAAPTCTSTVAVKSYSVRKSASTTNAAPGSKITYTVTVANTGQVAYTGAAPASFTDDLTSVLDDATFNNDATASAGPSPTFASPTLSWSGPLPVAATVTVTYSVTVQNPDAGDGSLQNRVVTPPASGGSCPAASVDPRCSSSVPVRTFSVVKSASTTTADPGDTVTYTIAVTNTGTKAYPSTNPASFTDDLTGVLDDAQYNEDATATSGPAPTYTAPVLSWSGPLGVGASVTVTYSVRIASPDAGDHLLSNGVLTPPGSGGNCPSATAGADCAPPPVKVQDFSVVKTDDHLVADLGDTIRYTVVVRNTGQVEFTSVDPVGFLDSLSGVLDDATYNDDASASGGAAAPTYAAPLLSWSGPLAVGATVTVTYSVTVNNPDTGDKLLDNALVTPTRLGGCPGPPTTPNVQLAPAVLVTSCHPAAIPVRSYTVAKSSPGTTARAGGRVTYQVTVTNTGGAPYTAADPATFTDDLSGVLDDATYDNDADHGARYAAPVLSWAGAVPVGASVVVAYSVTVNAPDRGDHQLGNAVVGPNCPVGTVSATCLVSKLVQSYDVTKTTTVTSANVGDSVSYTITVKNSGQVAYTEADPASFTDDLTAVLDDASYNDDADHGATYSAPQLHWSGALPVGGVVTVTYSVTVLAPDPGDQLLTNAAVTPVGSGGDCPATAANPACATSTPVNQQFAVAPIGGGEGLALTGTDLRLPLMLALLLIVAGVAAGAGALTFKRRRA
ncbi:uncharacterized repeat protein (TIGR01451 family) [Jatrophihabitans sp. GAS493]|uniref:DUF7927 domain-containing protein n=1 Tax=Jatrophihabitans sp. GAS493 TaxID=1907575 RepID=UPI000BB855DB|nr:DUF11 domain-containing protein [Jatrophihabitans sp. GAS493]SOD70768.1 uncharacterized repeat protein (TIGR01451 family) [Jatrophihabitans sp. GAS493]